MLLAERWILAALRNHSFFSLAELREAVKPLVEKLNDRVMQKLKKSRRQLFEEIERAALKPLPSAPYEFAEWRKAARSTSTTTSSSTTTSTACRTSPRRPAARPARHGDDRRGLRGLRRVTLARAQLREGRSTRRRRSTCPKAHRGAGRVDARAARSTGRRRRGPAPRRWWRRSCCGRAHPQQGFNACLGILHAARKTTTPERIERACARALRACGRARYRSVEAILKNNLDRQTPIDGGAAERAAAAREHPRRRLLPLTS